MFPAFLGVPRAISAKRARATRTIGGAPPAATTGFIVNPQAQQNWCWAAVSTSVALFYSQGSPWTQCSMANAELGRADCCGAGAAGPCNIPWYLDRALTRAGCFVALTGSAAPLADLQQEVATARVLCLRIGWLGGGGHFIAIRGWFTGGGGTIYVEVEDPIAGSVQLPYASLVSSYQAAGAWTHSYMTAPPAVRTIVPTARRSRAAIRSPKGG